MNIDLWCENFKSNDTYVIWGCSDFAEQLIGALGDKINFAYLVDISPDKQGKDFCGVPVCAPDKLLTDKDVKVIISNTYMGTRAKIVASLEDMGFVENINFTYIEIILSMFNWQLDHKIVSQYVEISTTTFCTLKCKNCTAYMPYVKNRCHIAVDELMQGCDAYFKCVDYVGRFRVLGGEPLIYPNLIELITYIGENYRNRIGEFCIVTNGTVKISDELMAVLKKYTVTLFVSNYSESGHHLATASHYDELLTILDKEKIPYHFTASAKWLELGSPMELREDSSDTQSLTERFNDCRHYCRSIVGNHLFMCATWAFSVLGGIYNDDWKKYVGDEILDMDALSQLDQKEKFAKWFKFDIEMDLENKYLDFCKYCNGFGSKNQNFVKVGEQA